MLTTNPVIQKTHQSGRAPQSSPHSLYIDMTMARQGTYPFLELLAVNQVIQETHQSGSAPPIYTLRPASQFWYCYSVAFGTELIFCLATGSGSLLQYLQLASLVTWRGYKIWYMAWWIRYGTTVNCPDHSWCCGSSALQVIQKIHRGTEYDL